MKSMFLSLLLLVLAPLATHGAMPADDMFYKHQNGAGAGAGGVKEGAARRSAGAPRHLGAMGGKKGGNKKMEDDGSDDDCESFVFEINVDDYVAERVYLNTDPESGDNTAGTVRLATTKLYEYGTTTEIGIYTERIEYLPFDELIGHAIVSTDFNPETGAYDSVGPHLITATNAFNTIYGASGVFKGEQAYMDYNIEERADGTVAYIIYAIICEY
jgi:hypothetical protein